MQYLRLRIRTLSRTPDDDTQEGEHLVSLVADALTRNGAGAVAVVVRATRTELVEVRGVVEAGIALPPFLAGLTRSETEGQGPALAVGLAGRFRLQRPSGGAPVALVFLEWPDCRWWQWRVMLDTRGQIVPDSETRRRAVDGDALEGGLGRWWSFGRRGGSVVRFGAPEPPAEASSSLVH